MLRLIEADLLKLRRRRGMLAVTATLTLGAVAIYYVVGAALDKATDFDSAVGILTLLAAVAGAIIGATAGGADIESGVFRDLVATGRSRSALWSTTGASAPRSPPTHRATPTSSPPCSPASSPKASRSSA